MNQRVAEAKETLPARPLRPLTPDEKQQIIQMWGKLPPEEQKFISKHEELNPEDMRELVKGVYGYYQTHPQSKPGDAFSNTLSEAGMMENSNTLMAKIYLDSINKRNLNKLENSGTRDPEAEVLFKPKPEKRESLRKSLSQMVKGMSISNKRDAVRLPPNALEDISAGDPKTPEAALAKAKAAARGSVRRPGDDDDNYV